MLATVSDTAQDAPNHPLAVRMGAIAFLSHNVIIGSIFGTSGVLLRPLQERFQVSTELSAAGVPLVILGSAVLASVAGVLAARFSLRSLLAGSAAISACAWLLLAFTQSYLVYLLAFGLLLGPAMSLAGAVLPPTLVTRWFSRHRGLAIGLVHLPVIVTIMPVAGNWVIEHYGVETLFLLLAGLSGFVLLPVTLLVVDHPPGETAREATSMAHAAPEAGGLSVAQLLKSPVFWALAMAVGAINTSSVLLGVHLVSMGESWGFTRDVSALLASIMAMVGILGSILFGVVADRIGGGRALALVTFDAGLLWLVLLLGLPFPVVAVVVGLIGMHGAGAIPSLSRAISDALGAASFSRAYGLATTVTLPLMVIGVVGTGTVYRLDGNYVVAILRHGGLFRRSDAAGDLGIAASVAGRLRTPPDGRHRLPCHRVAATLGDGRASVRRRAPAGAGEIIRIGIASACARASAKLANSASRSRLRRVGKITWISPVSARRSASAGAGPEQPGVLGGVDRNVDGARAEVGEEEARVEGRHPSAGTSGRRGPAARGRAASRSVRAPARARPARATGRAPPWPRRR